MKQTLHCGLAIALVAALSIGAAEKGAGGKKGKGRKAAKEAPAATARVQTASPSAEGWVSLFNGKDLTGWKQINGTAKYHVEDGCIVGTTVKGSPNSFLCTEKNYSDFEFECEVKCDPRLNSGIQIRSESKKEYKDGRVHGYQVEIADSANAGHVYDEARRARFLDLTEADKTKKGGPYKAGEWNKYRILCVGPRIQTWINDTKVADFTDTMTATGFIGLQVHAFKGEPEAQVRWRNIRIREINK